jgi:hypothetical protein
MRLRLGNRQQEALSFRSSQALLLGQSITSCERKIWVRRLKAGFVAVALSKEVNQLKLYDPKRSTDWNFYGLKEVL